MLSDLRFAFRSLARAPAIPLIAILTLALGIGSVTVSFSVLNALLLKPLPYVRHQERMLYVNEAIPSKGVDGTDICYADFLEWRRRTQTLGAIWVYDNRTVILAGPEEPVRVLGSGLSEGAFQAMGVQPVLGRNLRADDDEPKAPPVALISYELWQHHFGGRNLLGTVVTLNGQPTTIVGIMPAGWRYPDTSDVWVPLKKDAAGFHADFEYSGHAMLRPGVSLAQARAEMRAISGALEKDFPGTNAGLEVVLRPVREEATADTAQFTVLMFGAVSFVFLIACANVANLVLARASARSREIALRLALGAGRFRIVRQLLAESLVLSVLGGIGGLVIASWGAGLLLAAVPVDLPFWIRFDFDPAVFAFAFGLSVLSAVLFGLLPALQASRPDQIAEIKEDSRTATGGQHGHRLRHSLVIGEIALAFVLLVGAGLMIRSVISLHRVHPGFDSHGLLTFRVGFPPALSEDRDMFRRFYRDLWPRLQAIPGVDSAAAVSALPALGQGGYSPVLAEGQPEPKNLEETPAVLTRTASPGYFAAMRIPLVAGRSFAATDDANRPDVAVVDEEFVRRFFPQGNPLGKRFRIVDPRAAVPRWLEIVGVVASVRRWIDRDVPVPTFYRSFDQVPQNFMSVCLRLHGDPGAVGAAARQAVLSVNRNLPIYSLFTMDEALDQVTWTRRAFGTYLAAFAGLALFLAVIGIYGVMSFSVARRTHEIGVRMALGAAGGDVLKLVLGRGAWLVCWGLGLGLVAAFFVTRLLASSLYGVAPHDVLTFAAVPLVIAAVALAACLVPARRASRVDPLVALRAE